MNSNRTAWALVFAGVYLHLSTTPDPLNGAPVPINGSLNVGPVLILAGLAALFLA